MIQTDELALQRIGAVLLDAVEPPSDGAFPYEYGNLESVSYLTEIEVPIIRICDAA